MNIFIFEYVHISHCIKPLQLIAPFCVVIGSTGTLVDTLRQCAELCIDDKTTLQLRYADDCHRKFDCIDNSQQYYSH
jgi:hypothetical protein